MNTRGEETNIAQQNEKQKLLVSISSTLGEIAKVDVDAIKQPEKSVDFALIVTAARLVRDLLSKYSVQELVHESQNVPVNDDKILAFRKVCIRIYHKKRNESFDVLDENLILLNETVKELDTYAMFRAVLSPKTLNRMFEELDRLKKKEFFFRKDVQLAIELLHIFEKWENTADRQQQRILQDNIHVLSQLKSLVEMRILNGSIEDHFETEQHKILQEWKPLKQQAQELLHSETTTVVELESFLKRVSHLVGFSALQDRLSRFPVNNWQEQVRNFHSSLIKEANPILDALLKKMAIAESRMNRKG